MNYEMKIIKTEEFPEKLRNIDKKPKVLYAIGNTKLLYEDSFGIVGTRNPTEYGIKICKEFSKEIALRDITIISGMAEGIDKIAHQTSLECGAKTIGIIGCGFDCYLENKENTRMFSEIIKSKGLIVSEYNLGVEKCKENYPQRNRIIAALSEGVLVVEAAYRSGSSITARFANSYGKNVFAVPGKINDKMSVGTNNLIKKGAILVTDAREIIKSYPQFENKKRKNTIKTNYIEQEKNILEDWKEIIGFLEKDTLLAEELKVKTKKDTRELMKILSEMEMEGIIYQEIGEGYSLKK